MALTFANAITVAQMELNKIQRFGQIYALVPENACETPYGWLIPWSQSDYRFTKEVRLGGNPPFFVDRFSGAVCQVSAIHHDFQEWLRAYALRQGYTDDAEPDASPNRGQAEPRDSSSIDGGPPSVS